ncbi:hypothetical protein B0H19DRAFT_1240442 [Mycena capillaripes]|nr:hypothetical protein B0H19DRAFT_1240442 [Mycena capillaripes]
MDLVHKAAHHLSMTPISINSMITSLSLLSSRINTEHDDGDDSSERDDDSRSPPPLAQRGGPGTGHERHTEEQLPVERKKHKRYMQAGNVLRLPQWLDRLQKTDDALAIAEHDITEFQAAEQAARATIEGLTRRIVLLEKELDGVKWNMKETEEKLRQLEAKAEHLERHS